MSMKSSMSISAIWIATFIVGALQTNLKRFRHALGNINQHRCAFGEHCPQLFCEIGQANGECALCFRCAGMKFFPS